MRVLPRRKVPDGRLVRTTSTRSFSLVLTRSLFLLRTACLCLWFSLALSFSTAYCVSLSLVLTRSLFLYCVLRVWLSGSHSLSLSLLRTACLALYCQYLSDTFSLCFSVSIARSLSCPLLARALILIIGGGERQISAMNPQTHTFSIDETVGGGGVEVHGEEKQKWFVEITPFLVFLIKSRDRGGHKFPPLPFRVPRSIRFRVRALQP